MKAAQPSFFSGDDGGRTRVQKSIPRSSTIIVFTFTFPLPDDQRHPSGFSSFILRLPIQSFTDIVSHMNDAGYLKCECLRPTAAVRQLLMNNYR